jgi:polysaccharide biosynthesis protein PslA
VAGRSDFNQPPLRRPLNHTPGSRSAPAGKVNWRELCAKRREAFSPKGEFSMSKAAAAPSSAKTEQKHAAAIARGAGGFDADELAAAYALFGLSPEPIEAPPARPAELSQQQRSEAFAMFGETESAPQIAEAAPAPSAEAAYLASAAPIAAPANEHAEAQIASPAVQEAPAPARTGVFPVLKPRGLRVPPIAGVRLLQIMDWLIVALAAEFAARWALGASLAVLTIPQAAAVLVGALSLKAGLWLTDAYKLTPGQIRPEQGAGGLAIGAIAGLAGAAALAPHAAAAAALAAVLPIAAIMLAGLHAAFALWLNAAHRAGAFAERIVVIGATQAAERLVARAVETGEARIVAVVEDRLSRAPVCVAGAPVLGTVQDLLAWPSLPEVDRIIITVTPKAEARVRDLITRLRIAPNRIDLLFDLDAETVNGKGVKRIANAPAACVSGRAHCATRAFIKRAEDLLIGSALLLAFAPLMALIALAVRLTSKGPILFRQRRHGFNNRVITVWKFRTMRNEPVTADAPLQQVQAKDPRVTPLGRFLRVFSLDELPQLFNVLGGDMSLVGPRPHAVNMRASDQALEDIVAEYAHRHRVKPGITGWAQVNGSRGPIETPELVRERVRLDLEYVTKNSLWLDIWILICTAPSFFGDSKATR